MKAIYKYPIPPEGTTIYVSPEYKILSAQLQRENLCVWIMIDPHVHNSKPLEFSVMGTGWNLDDRLAKQTYIGTIQPDNLVFHVFCDETKS